MFLTYIITCLVINENTYEYKVYAIPHVIAQKDVIYRQIQNNAIKYSYWGKQVCHNKSSLNEKQLTTYFQVHVN